MWRCTALFNWNDGTPPRWHPTTPMAPARGATTFRTVPRLKCSGAPCGCQALAPRGDVGWQTIDTTTRDAILIILAAMPIGIGSLLIGVAFRLV